MEPFHGALSEMISPDGLTVPGAPVADIGAGHFPTRLAQRLFDQVRKRRHVADDQLAVVPFDHLRARISLVSQDTYLFNDTLRANVALARPDADVRLP